VMNKKRSLARPLFPHAMTLIAVALFFSGLLANAQEAYLKCVNDYQPPLVSLNFPCFPQILHANIVIITDTKTPMGVHSVTVVNTDYGNDVAVFYFNVGAGGAVTPNTHVETYQYGQTPSGPAKFFYTTIGTYSFAGDNFPLSAWPDDPNWQAPPIVDHRRFDLDEGPGYVATQSNSEPLRIESDYHYTKWARSTFLGYQGPYTPGASAALPVEYSVKSSICAQVHTPIPIRLTWLRP